MGTKSDPYHFNVAPGKQMCWCYLVNAVINLDVPCGERNFSTS
jgi:hypothetical protein